jgi:hypothetical protein
MKGNVRGAIVILGLMLLVPLKTAFAEPEGFKHLSAQWWEWVLSIPTSVNPLLDVTGEDCMVGQSGSTWFLAGIFGDSQQVTRTCTVPADRELFLPVVNSVNFNSPNVCGSGPENISVKDLRAYSAGSIDGAANVSAELDGLEIKNVHRVVSEVFSVALPEENLFVAPCAGDAPAGVYSPAVDDGYYVNLKPLATGNHTLHFHAELPAQGFTLDVTYNLIVVPVLKK